MRVNLRPNAGRWGIWLRIGVVILSALSVLLVAACGPDPQPLQFAATPWRAGEISVYQITDVNGVAAGMARYAIEGGANATNPAGWIIRREVDAQGDNEVATVEVNAGLRPQNSLLTRTGAQGQQVVKALYNQGQVDMELTNQRVTTVERVNIPSDAYDEYMLWQLGRALPLAEGYVTQLNTFHTITGLQNRVTVAVVGTETINVPAGNYATWQVEFTIDESKSTVWYSQDEQHILVKFVEGRNQGTFTLVEYQAGE